MKTIEKSISRISEMLKRDKENLSDSFLQQIKSDAYDVFNKYFFINLTDVRVSYYVDERCNYNITLNAQANRIKNMMFF